MRSAIIATQVVSISISLFAAGGIAALSVFDVPELQSQPASRSLPSIRWLFSRGSHIFPQAAFLSSAGFAYLAFDALPIAHRALPQLLKLASNGFKVNGYLAAAALTISIGPFTGYMIPTNFALIKMNEERGGVRSGQSACQSNERGKRSADNSVNGKGEVEEFTDLSGPQTQTDGHTTDEEDRRVKELLGKFAAMNAVRAVLLGGGGIVGLCAALA